tara:strand:- start:269 stop:430 length:162 start_codon:yes stop_codon:yes gene_type:complete
MIKVGDVVVDLCDADKTPGVVLESYCGKCLVWYRSDFIIWTYFKDLKVIYKCT